MSKRIRVWLIGLAVCLALAALLGILAVPGTTLADKAVNGIHNHGDDGGGGDQPCVIFDDMPEDSVGSDDGTPYCDNKKLKITVAFSQAPAHLRLQTNSSNKAGAGRGLFVDFGTDVTIAPGTVNEMVIQTTDEALADPRVLAVEGVVGVGAFQDDFDFFNMVENPDSNVNLNIRLVFWFTEGFSDGLLIRLAPNEIGNNRHCPSSDSVTVTDLGTPDPDGLHKWRVETQTVVQGACISRSGEGEFLDTNLLTDVNDESDPNPFELDPGHIALSFGFTVTAAP